MENNAQTLVIVDEMLEVDKALTPFGKRWASQCVQITPAHLRALEQGKYLAIDAQGEYLVYLKLEDVTHV